MNVLFAHPAKSLSPLPDIVYPYLNSIRTVSGDYLRIVTAIEQGRTIPHRQCLSNCPSPNLALKLLTLTLALCPHQGSNLTLAITLAITLM
jgi:hypothetical protein